MGKRYTQVVNREHAVEWLGQELDLENGQRFSAWEKALGKTYKEIACQDDCEAEVIRCVGPLAIFISVWLGGREQRVSTCMPESRERGPGFPRG